MTSFPVHIKKRRLCLTDDDFSRLDESDDRQFYATNRFTAHLDRQALQTVEQLIGALIVEEKPEILDLMASVDSHLPASVKPERVTGLGLNENELQANPVLTEHVIHDLNADPVLPFPDESFDVVLNTVSVDYMTRPLEVFEEVFRVLKPGGLFLVIFSNRYFKQKATKIWRHSEENERQSLVEVFFSATDGFESPRPYVSQGLPRPEDDKYTPLGIPSDPVQAVYAEKKGRPETRNRRPRPASQSGLDIDPWKLERLKQNVRHTLECPYCQEKLKRWEVPQTPFTEWDNEFMYVCFNDQCPYLCAGWSVMQEQGNAGFSYRLMYDPIRDCCMPAPVPNVKASRETPVASRG